MTLATLEKMYGQRPRHHYRAFGLHIRSELGLPGLASADPEAFEPDVSIAIGPVPDVPNSSARASRADDEIVLRLRGIARYQIRGGNEITVDPLPESSIARVRMFLLGSALGALCHQRGLLVLHANALVVDGHAVAFAGNSGAGKSTLVAHFHARGYQVLSDDTCVVSFDTDRRPLVWPGLQQVKLWRDAAEFFGHSLEPQARVADGMEKYRVPLGREADGPFPLTCIYVLGEAPAASTPQLNRLSGLQALNAIMSHTYRGEYIKRMGLMRRHFAQSLAVLDRVPVYAALHRRGLHVLTSQAAEFERHFRAPAAAPLATVAE